MATQSKKKIINEYSQAVFNLPWLVADQKGLFAEEGLEVEFIRARQWDPSKGPIADPTQVDPFWRHAPYREGEAASFNACEWGQIRRANDTGERARIVNLRPAIACQSIFTVPGSGITYPAALRNKTVAVNFHAGSHYLALQMLEGFMEREEIKVVHMGQAKLRLQALLDGTVDAAMLMEPFIAAAEKLECTLVLEGFYAGSEMLAPDLDTASVQAINRALTRAVDLINADKQQFLPFIMADAPNDLVQLTADDFKLSRLRYVYPRPYPEEEFARTYQWMRSWDLIPEGATYESLVDNRVAAG